MTRRKKDNAQKLLEKDALIQQALDGLKNGIYQSERHAARELKIPASTLNHRINGRSSHSKIHEDTQALTPPEEAELVRWITQLTITGYSPTHALLRSMAETIRKGRVLQSNDSDYKDPLGTDWVRRFLLRHPQLKSVVGHRIDTVWIKDASKEVLERWFNAFEQTVKQYQIIKENIYNFDESGFSIGQIQATRVIINSRIRQKYQVNPGRQEWVSAIECICADGSSISPLIIFKGENLSKQWIPADIHSDWKFACNTKGWTSNQHGLEWLRRCFEPSTREKANGKPRLLICDGHASHVTGDFIAYCMYHNIVLLLLPPHTSHLTQPLDVAVFGPLKRYMAMELQELIQTEISRLQKAEWLGAYVRARARAFSTTNNCSGFSGAGLVPFRQSKVLRRVASSPTPPPRSATPETRTPFENPDLTSSPVDITLFREANLELTRVVDAQQPLSTPARQHVHRLAKATERLFARQSITEKEKDALRSVVGARKMRESGKRGVLKTKHVLTKAEIYSQVRRAEEATQARKKPTANSSIDPSLIAPPTRQKFSEGCESTYHVFGEWIGNEE